MAPPLRAARRGEPSFEAFLAYVDRLFYTCVVAFALCVTSMLML
jgi:hypothetical protein